MTEEASGPVGKVVERWLVDPDAPDGWHVLRRARLRLHDEIVVEGTIRWLPTRQRYRLAPQARAAIPGDLKAVFKGQGWRTMADLLPRIAGHRLVLDEMLDDWLHDGWIEVEEKATGKPEIWAIEKARVSPAAAEILYLAPKLERKDLLASEMVALKHKLKGWQADADQARSRWQGHEQISVAVEKLASDVTAQDLALKQGLWEPIAGWPQRPGDAPHRRWICILRGLLAHLAAGQWQYERSFSAVWLGDSKALALERPEVARYLGVAHLDEIGLFPHTPVVLAWGQFTASCDGHRVDGQAGIPFVAISAATIRRAVDWQVTADAIVVIENQTAFEMALRPPLLDERTLYLFSSGHAGMAERELLKCWLGARSDLPWYVWTDWDLGGVRIQADWARWAALQALPAPRPALWKARLFDRWQDRGQELSDRHQRLLEKTSDPLAEPLLRYGLCWEQEAVLDDLTALDATILDILCL